MTTQAAEVINLNNGLEMPVIGLGVFQSPPEETVGAVEAALAAEYRLIDTAAAYGNEREVGEGVRRSGIERGEVFVTTKLWISDYGYEPALDVKENIDIFDFMLTSDEVAAIDELDTGVRVGPDPETIDTTRYPFQVQN